MERQDIDRICYRILLSIGDSLELRKMIGNSLAVYMQELSCNMGAIMLLKEGEESLGELEITYSIPRSIDKNIAFKELLHDVMHRELFEDMVVRKGVGDSGLFYLMSLSDIGLLILHCQSHPIDEDLLAALHPLNRKLGTACKACLQNTKLQKSSQQFKEMANMLPGLIIEIDQQYAVTFFNERTQEIFKQIDSDEFNPKEVFDFFLPTEIPKVKKLLANCEKLETIASADLVMKNSRSELFMVNFIIAPIIFGGKITGFRGIAIDISERVKLEKDLILRDRLLNAITLSTQGLLKSQDYTTSIPLALELLGKATLVDRVYYFKNSFDSDGTVITTSQKAEWSATSITPQIDNPELQDVPAEAVELFLSPLKNRKPFIAIIDELPESVTKDILAAQDIKSILVLPIFLKKNLWGFVGFDDCQRKRTWSIIERDLLDLFATSISEAIERKQAEDEINKLYRDIMDDLETAQSIQKSILPAWFRKNNDLIISANYLPWTKIGGDLFDCIELPDNRYVIYVADISGHGIQAALTMTAVKAIFSMVIRGEQQDPEPAKVVTKLNEIVSKRLFQDNYLTLCYCLIDANSSTITTLSAGHPPLMIHNVKTGEKTILGEKGEIPLGWIASYQFNSSQTQTLSLKPDDIICLMTDGVFECVNEHKEMLGIDPLFHLIGEQLQQNHLITLPHIMYSHIESLGYVQRSDDFTFVAFQVYSQQREPQEHYWEIPAKLDKVDEAAQSCQEFILSVGGNDMQAYTTRLIASEFLSNIVEHGFSGSVQEVIAMSIQVQPDIVLTFYDNAGAWNLPPKEQYVSDFFEHLNTESTTRGRGLQIIHALTKHHVRKRIHQINLTQFTLADTQ